MYSKFDKKDDELSWEIRNFSSFEKKLQNKFMELKITQFGSV